MKKLIFLLTIILSLNFYAQDSLSIKIHPTKKYPWTVLYQLKNVKQEYVDNKQQNKDSAFVYNMKGQPSGMYLLMYDMDNRNFIYFIYNNESVDLEVFPFQHNKILVRKSKENKVFLPYASKHNMWVSQLNEFEQKLHKGKLSNSDKKEFAKVMSSLKDLQTVYLKKSSGLMVHKYIMAMDEYYPDINLSKKAYWKAKKSQYFKHLDFNDTDLQHSNIIINKINNYVFNIDPPTDPKNKHLEYMKRIEEILPKIKDQTYRDNVIISLTNSFIETDGRVTKMLIEKYIKNMPEADKRNVNIKAILDQVGLTIGEKAPEFTFKDFLEQKHSFHKIIKQKPYTLLIFWGATCPHCLHALPEVKKMIKNRKDFNVVAIGIEYEKYPWSAEQQNYPEFYHGLKLKKWQNPIVKTYGVHATPTFFIVDHNGYIIAKPYMVEDIQSWLNMHPVK